MKNMEIKSLVWDSDFFGFQIGEIENNSDLSTANNFDLIILKQQRDEVIKIPNFDKKFQETKIFYSKILSVQNSSLIDSSVIDFDNFPVSKDSFYQLAFISGKYSRFKLDLNFKQNKFELIYKKWVDNSIAKDFADKIFYVKELNEVIGFVTVKNNVNFSTIGLIAVAENHQGKGIGKKLVLNVEKYCISINIFELRIPTQKENTVACHFYINMGFNINEETIIKHYWNVSYKKNKF